MSHRSKRAHEGYIMLDHRNSPGVTPEMLATGHYLPAPEGKVFEAPIIRCNHCGTMLVVNPARTRAREHCPKCDHYICDGCGLARKLDGGECLPVDKKHDIMAEENLLLIGKG